MTRYCIRNYLRDISDYSEEFHSSVVSLNSCQDLVDEIFDEFEDRSCKTCTYGAEEDGGGYSCRLSRDLFGWGDVVLPKDFYCSRYKKNNE